MEMREEYQAIVWVYRQILLGYKQINTAKFIWEIQPRELWIWTFWTFFRACEKCQAPTSPHAHYPLNYHLPLSKSKKYQFAYLALRERLWDSLVPLAFLAAMGKNHTMVILYI